MAKTIKLPKMRRKYFGVFGLDKGLKLDIGATFIDNDRTPNCEEVELKDAKIETARGTKYFANTSTSPVDGSVMLLKEYNKDGTIKLICHTTSRVYYYNSTTNKFVSLVDETTNLVSRFEVTS